MNSSLLEHVDLRTQVDLVRQLSVHLLLQLILQCEHLCVNILFTSTRNKSYSGCWVVFTMSHFYTGHFNDQETINLGSPCVQFTLMRGL